MIRVDTDEGSRLKCDFVNRYGVRQLVCAPPRYRFDHVFVNRRV